MESPHTLLCFIVVYNQRNINLASRKKQNSEADTDVNKFLLFSATFRVTPQPGVPLINQREIQQMAQPQRFGRSEKKTTPTNLIP